MEVPAEFILNLFIAFLWMTFQDEDELRLSTFFVGFIVGIVIIFLMHRFFGTRFYLRRFYSVIKLILIFISELFQSGFLVMKHILSRDIDRKSTRLNSSHVAISYAVFCLKKKNTHKQ